jgi:uncharacterized membrane protein
MRKILLAIVILSVIGLGTATYSFFHNQGFAPGEFCAIGETFDCDVVNKGPYSKLFGIPVSLVGILGYAFLGAAAFLKLRDEKDKMLTIFLVSASTIGFGFTLYLSGLEAFVLHTWCLLCLTSQGIMAMIFLLSIVLWHKERKRGILNKLSPIIE